MPDVLFQACSGLKRYIEIVLRILDGQSANTLSLAIFFWAPCTFASLRMPKTEILFHVAQTSFSLSAQILSHHADAYKIGYFAGEAEHS